MSQQSIPSRVTTSTSPPPSGLPNVLVVLGPLALLGRCLEFPFTWTHERLRAHRRRLVLWYGLLALAVVPPVKSDFLGFDLIPLSGSLLLDIRDFYLNYQKQIMALKKLAVSYYYARQIDVDQLKRDLGELAELELTDGFRSLLNNQAANYAEALTYDGDQQHTDSDMQAASHDGQLQRGLRYRVEDNDGSARYLTNSEIWNELFNPYDPNWNPAMTHETYLVLQARLRWLSRELGRYRRAVRTWRKLANIHNGLYLDSIEQASVSAAVRYAISSSLEVDQVSAQVKSMQEGPLKAYLQNRLEHWQTRVDEVQDEVNRIRRVMGQMRGDMTQMERRALTMVSAKIRQRSLGKWNYVLPPVASKTHFTPIKHVHWSPFPKGWQ